MSYLVFARKYRPANFESVTGQEHVTRTLKNAILRDRVAHAYLFAGPRGVGKTSIARIFSKALNCTEGPTVTPCLKCSNCIEIAQSTSLAVREIDGASHNSVDNVRELIDSFRSLPAPGSKYKIYIIDEVHMLSTAAFNALLKSLEEPPKNTIFMFATTELHKIPETVISRCQKHELRALSPTLLLEGLKNVVTSEKIKIEEEVLQAITRMADGSMRDAQSLLDRVVSFCEGEVTSKEAVKVLGVVEKRLLFDLSEAIFSRDVENVLRITHEIFATSVDTTVFLKDFVSHFRELLVAKFSGERGLTQFQVPAHFIVELRRQAEPVSAADIQDLVDIAREGADSALRSFHPRYALEALVVRMACREPARDLAVLLDKLEQGGSVSRAVETQKPQQHRAIEPRENVAVPATQQRPVPSAPSEAPKARAEEPSGKTLDWPMFVRKVASAGGSRMLSEHLKRLGIESFIAGTLVARGPDFSVTYLEAKDNKEKLLEVLRTHTGVKDWRVTLKKGAAPDGNSLIEQQQKEEEKQRVDRERDAASHPTIQSLQKAFPGSKIESIRVKE